MPPIRVKVYGLLPLTKRAYLVVQGIGLAVVVAAIVVGVCLPRPVPPPGEELPPFVATQVALLDFLPWLAVLFLIAGMVETCLVLGRFARKEAAQRAAAP